MTTVVASAAAQGSTAPQVPAWVQTEQAVQNFVAAEPSGQVRNFNSTLAISKGFGFNSAVVRQGSGQVVVPILLVGVTDWGGFGFVVGGGVWLENFTGNENFILEIDGTWSNAGGCSGCDVFGGDFSASTISIGAAFLYKFKEMSSGWTPFAGGGIYWSRFSYDFGDDIFGTCDFIECSASNVYLLIKGGLYKGKIGFEGRVGSGLGGSFAAAFIYRFKG